jgi:hypothetical protein
MAWQFTGHGSVQAIIDAAVRAYVVALAGSSPGYREALEALDPRLLADIGLVRPIQRPRL